MYSRILTPPENTSFFLFGPRGSGKTSWLKLKYPEALYIDLLNDETYSALLSFPTRLSDWVKESSKKLVIIDEVQKLPKILDEVHRLIEKKNCRFILTGSSARKLRRRGVNLLAGRALTLHLHPLTVLELGRDFNVKYALQYGQLPQVIGHENPKAFLKSYVTTYLKEEVQQEGLTRNIGAFARFLESASFGQAATLNISDVARDASIERKIVEQYFTILEDLLLAVRLPVFSKRAKRTMTAHPKFLFFDVGVFRSIRPRGPLDSPEEIDGPALETLFCQELRALNDYFDMGYNLAFWRTQSKIEVDFVVHGELGLRAFEIKRTTKLRTADLSGLHYFISDYPQAKAYCLYGGTREYESNGIRVLPFLKGIQSLKAILSGQYD